MASQYVDEKHPDVIYEVVPVIEEAQVRKRRPVWRRVVRFFVTLTIMTMLWSTFAPVVHYKIHHRCGGMNRHHHRPSHDILPPSDLDLSFDTSDRPLQHYTFPPDLDHFWLSQETFGGGLTRTNVIGKVIVASCSKAENISAHFKIDASDDGLLDKIEINARKDGISFKLDPFSLVKQTVNATVFLVIPKKDDYKLNHLKVNTIQLNVWLTKSLTTPINGTKITTVSGHVGSRGTGNDLLDINNLKIATTSGSIKGDYPIEHALALESTSGTIDVLLASEKLPEQIAWFKTATTSGETNAVFDGNLNPRPLYSKHTSVSGSIHIHYPEDWQGGLRLETTSGDIDVVGKGTKVVKKEKDLTKKLWEVIKGDGKSKGYIGTVSGAIDVSIGDTE